jgi:hypothetical protein
MGSLKVSITALAAHARELRSEHGENAEYDRALVELVNRASGLPDDTRVITARTLGIPQDPFIIPVEPVPTEITLKVVLDLLPGDDVRDAMSEYFAEHGIPEPVSTTPLD